MNKELRGQIRDWTVVASFAVVFTVAAVADQVLKALCPRGRKNVSERD